MEAWLQDLRFALRSFRRAPWPAAAAALTLALGTGLNTAVVAVAYGVLLRPLPVREPAGLVLLAREEAGAGFLVVPSSAFREWRARLRLLEPAAYDRAPYTFRAEGEPRTINVALVSDRFFEVLGLTPAFGRPVLDPAAPGVVLSAALADSLAAAGSLPSDVVIGGSSYPVAAVLPHPVSLPDEADTVDAWLPLEAAPGQSIFGPSRERYVQMLARLGPGVTLAQARDDVRRVEGELARARPSRSPRRLEVTVIPVSERVAGRVRPILLVFVAAAALVLLVACANVASLLVARAIGREKDVAVRLALGAGRARVLRAQLVDALVLAAAGAAGGVLLASLGVRVLTVLGSAILPRLDAVAVDLPVLLASLATAALVSILCGVAPGLHALRTDIAPVFRQTGASATPLGRRLTAVLVVAQIAASIVLLTGAVLLARTVVRLLASDLGVKAGRAATVELMLTETTGPPAGNRAPFVHDLLEAIRAVPGVSAAGIGTSLPPAASSMSMSVRIEDGEQVTNHAMDLAAVSPGYLEAIGTRLLSGRLFDDRDDAGDASVVVLSESVARDLFPGLDPIGQQLSFDAPGDRDGHARVVGMVGDVKFSGLDRPPSPTLYVPWGHLPAGSVHLVMRTVGDPIALVPTLRQIIRRLDPAQPIGRAMSLEEVVSGSVADRRVYAWLAVGLAALAFVVALVGLVASLVRSVAERHREIAIRAALGASPEHTVRAVVGHGLFLALAGLGLGLAAAVAAARGLAGFLYGVSAYDPFTYVWVSLGVTVTVVAACYVPARRAARVSPAELMRAE